MFRMSLSALKISNYFSLPMKIVLQGQSVSSIVMKSVQADSNESDFKAKYEVQDGKVLHAAASFGNTEVIELILSQGFHLDSRNRKGVTPLMTAALNDEQNAFEILIQNGADPSFKDNDGFSLLHCAAEGGNTSIIIKLLSLGLDVDSRNNGGVTPLMTAALNDKQNALTSWYKTVLIHLSKTTTGSVCSTLLRKVEIPPLSASCYHLVLTLIQGTMVGSLYWWLQPSTTNKMLLRSWYKTVLIHLSKTTMGSVCSTLLHKVEIPALSTSCYNLVCGHFYCASTNSSFEARVLHINVCIFLILCTVEPRFKEGTRDLQNVFAIQRFRYIQVLFQIFYYYWRGKKIARSTEEFVI